MYKLTITLLISSLYFSLVAQINLVPNPGFEDYSMCPVSFSGIEYYSDTYVDNWLRPTGGSSDYFNECASAASYVDVPTSYFMLYQPAHGGAAYAGGYVWYESFFYREYIQVELIEPMVAGECYYVEFYTAPAETEDVFLGSITTDRIGLYISEDRPTEDPDFYYESLDVEPQIINPVGVFITDTASWTKISGVYVAEGDEQWITIGNFYTDDETELFDFLDHDGSSFAYFIYDDFLVAPLTAIDVLQDSILCAGDTYTLEMYDGASSYLWNTGDTTQSISVSETGEYSVIVEYACGIFYDTATVYFNIDSNYTSEYFAEICYTDLPYTISGSDLYTIYNWNTGDTTQSINITESGEYILSAYGGCSSYTDTFDIVVIDLVPEAMDLEDTLLICEVNGTAALTGPDDFDNYNWSTSETTQEIVVSADGNYTLTYSKDCDTYTHTFTVISDPYLLTEFNLPDNVLLCTLVEPSVILSAGADLPNYLWSTGETTSSIQVNTPGVYTVSSTTLCTEKTGSVAVESCLVMTVPNAFTPNADGINDVFAALCEPCSNFLSLTIYNRWGELIFESTDFSVGWDGKYGSDDAELGSYTYVLRYLENGTEQMRSGGVILIR